MNLAIIGRTPLLVSIARRVLADGHIVRLVATPNDHGASKPFRVFARDCRAEFIETTKINCEPVLERLRAADCEVGVSLNWRTLIKPETLACFRHGVLNGHAGDLPRYRGNACPNWAILQDEPHIGLCVHEMARELDAGPVYARARLPLAADTYITDVQAWIDATAPKLFAEALAAIARGEAPAPQSADPAAGLRCYPRRASDARINWRQSAMRIHRLVRASSRPFDGAFCFLERRRITIWRAEVADPAQNSLAIPGQPCEPIDGDPLIACGDGYLRLRDVSIGQLSQQDSKAEINRSVRLRLT